MRIMAATSSAAPAYSAPDYNAFVSKQAAIEQIVGTAPNKKTSIETLMLLARAGAWTIADMTTIMNSIKRFQDMTFHNDPGLALHRVKTTRVLSRAIEILKSTPEYLTTPPPPPFPPPRPGMEYLEKNRYVDDPAKHVM